MAFDHLPYDKRPRTMQLNEAEKTELCRRMVLTEIGMPRLCVLRRCRRKRKCFGPNMVCAWHHAGLVEARVAALERRLGRNPRPGRG